MLQTVFLNALNFSRAVHGGWCRGSIPKYSLFQRTRYHLLFMVEVRVLLFCFLATGPVVLWKYNIGDKTGFRVRFTSGPLVSRLDFQRSSVTLGTHTLIRMIIWPEARDSSTRTVGVEQDDRTPRNILIIERCRKVCRVFYTLKKPQRVQPSINRHSYIHWVSNTHWTLESTELWIISELSPLYLCASLPELLFSTDTLLMQFHI